MDLETFREHYGYNRWANARSLQAASAVSPADFTKEVGGSFASLRGTLAHVYGAEWIWLERWRGNSPRSLPFSLDFPDVEAIRTRWLDVEREQREFLDALDPARLAEVISYVNLKGETFAYRFVACSSTSSTTRATTADRSPRCCGSSGPRPSRPTCCSTTTSAPRRRDDERS